MKGYGTDHKGEGNCKYHGGAGEQFEEGNNENEKHSLYSKRSLYYENRNAEEKAWIDTLISSMLDDAPFTKDDFQKFQMLRNIAIDMHKLRTANDYMEENGLIEEDFVRDEDGNPIIRDGEYVTESKENPINLVYDRVNRTKTKEMKELGLLDDPDSRQADAQQNIATQLSQLREDSE